MSSAPQRKLTSAEYLEMERASEHRNIFWHGDIFAMSGATRQHVKIAGNVFRRIHVAFDENDCEVMQSDMRVKNEAHRFVLLPRRGGDLQIAKV